MTGPLMALNFGPVWGASGVQGWFGEGYRHHRWLGPLRPRFDGMTFVAKTTTAFGRPGNMPLRDDWTPREVFPRCISVNPRAGYVLNAVGLSGPGLTALLNTGRWQQLVDPFFMSFMSVAETRAERLRETTEFVRRLAPHLREFQAPVGLQVNFSCPNVGLDTAELIDEVDDALAAVSSLPFAAVVPKFNVLLSIDAAFKISDGGRCSAICMSNTLPYGKLPDRVEWTRMFGAESPLKHLGGGGLSGAPLFPLVRAWVGTAKRAGLKVPLNVGGGIMCASDIDRLVAVGVDFAKDSVFVGSVAILRPWRVASIIRRAYFWREKHRLFNPLSA